MKSLFDLNHELIKAHFLDPDNSPLSTKHQDMLARLQSMANLSSSHTNKKLMVALHRSKYPHISRSQAYEDLNSAKRVFETIHTFDYDFWQIWLMDDIARNIKECRKVDSIENKEAIAREHANMAKALAMVPINKEDLQRDEEHNFYIVTDQDELKGMDADELHNMPEASISDIKKEFKPKKVGVKLKPKS